MLKSNTHTWVMCNLDQLNMRISNVSKSGEPPGNLKVELVQNCTQNLVKVKLNGKGDIWWRIHFFNVLL